MGNRVLLFGAPGQMGQAFQYVWGTTPVRPDWQLCFLGRQDCDIADPIALRGAIQSFKPDLLINFAGLTHVDQAQKNEDVAMAVNFHAPANMAAQCSALDVPMIHLSTDYVFDGRQTRPYLPDDQMNPINIYGASKMMGEEALRNELAWHVILRVSSVFSAFRRNILTGAIKMIDEKDELRMVSDMVSCPTPATHIAQAVLTIGEALLKGKADGFGTFHLCGTPPCSRLELTEAIMEAYAPHTSRRPKITPTVSAEFADLAPRPAYSVMDCAKIKAVYGIEQRPWREGLTEAMEILFSKDGRFRL